MKKLLNFLGISSFLLTSVSGVVSCKTKNDTKDVIFMIDALTTTSSSIINAYKDVVDEFNNNHNNNGIKVTIETPAAGQILNSINAGEALPDLYLTYPDNVSRYKSLIPNEIINVEKDGYIADDQTFKAYQKSFLEEGTIGDELYVLPVLKSFDVNTINLRILREMTEKLKSPNTNFNPNGVFEKNELGLKVKNKDIKIKSSKLFEDRKTILDSDKNLYDKIAETANGTELRRILQLDENILKLAKDFKSLKLNQNHKTKAYALGIDSLENKVFANYANDLEKQRIETSKENKKFIYNYYDNQLYVNDKSGVTPTEEQIKWLEELRKIENPQGSLNSNPSDTNNQGTLFVANSDDGKKIYSSSYFAQGTMLMASGSTAGSFYYSTPSKDIKNQKVSKDLAVDTTDLFVVAESSKKGKSYIMQQGPGIGAFKSSSEEKTKVAKEFTNFLMNKDNMAHMAIWSGYMPANQLSYTETEYNDWIMGTKKVKDRNNTEKDRKNLILSQVVKLLDDKKENNFVTIESSEPGNAIRDKVFKNTMQSGLYKSSSELTIDKFWNGEKGKISYTGAKNHFTTIASDLDPNMKPIYEATFLRNNLVSFVVLNRRED